MIRWFCTGASITAHNKMAAVKKKEHLSNIIKMKVTEEESYWNFCLRLFLAEVRLDVLCVGNVLNGSSTRVCC